MTDYVKEAKKGRYTMTESKKQRKLHKKANKFLNEMEKCGCNRLEFEGSLGSIKARIMKKGEHNET